MPPPSKPRVGLVLTGGGARAAYQVGVLRAIAAMLPPGAHNPFPIICGTSAGAVNAASLAVTATDFQEGVQQLAEVWGKLHVSQIYRSDPVGALGNSARWLGTLLLGGLGRHSAVSLLNNSPLEQTLERSLPFRSIQKSIRAGALHALGITAWGYTSGQSVTFYQGASGIMPWKRVRRIGIPARINAEHLMASSAIPFFFPATRLNREYFGDGSMRQLAPLSPALHLGADRVLVVGVRKMVETVPDRVKVAGHPPLAQIAGHVMSSIFLDSLDVDLERLQRINNTIRLIPREARERGEMLLRPIESMVIAPSEEINRIAERHAHALPPTIRFLYRAIGAMGRDGSTLLSYVLFEEPFCQALIELGYRDTLPLKAEILRFLGIDAEGRGEAGIIP